MSYDLKIFDDSGELIASVPFPGPSARRDPQGGAARDDKDIRPSVLGCPDREAPHLRASERQRIIGEIAAACDCSSVLVQDVRTTFHVPVATFLDHVRTDALLALRTTVRDFATRLARHAGRTEPALFVERVGALDYQLFHELEERFLDVVVEAGELSGDLVIPDALQEAAQSGAVARRCELLDETGRKARQRIGRGGELSGSVSGVGHDAHPSKGAKKRRCVSKSKRARR